MLHNELKIEYAKLSELKTYHRQLRKPKKQVEKTKRLIETIGLFTPIIIDQDGTIIVGWNLVEAARLLNMDVVPVIRISHLNAQQIRILRIAYDRIAEEAEWDKEALAAEFAELQVLTPDLTITGFEIEEINITLDLLSGGNPNDIVPEVLEGPAVTQLGDIYVMDEHKLLCGDALEDDSYRALMGTEKAQMCFTDQPYNVPITGHAGNSGSKKHREFVEASGEMGTIEFEQFTECAHQRIAAYCIDGAIIFSCMDWRHMPEMHAAARAANLELNNICVWVKDNGGMGSLYRSRHEFVFVFKKGKAKHINNVQLGSNGRYRTNVWEYPGVNSFGGGRMDELKMHPTVKPVDMVADAIKDCSKRDGIILDPFGGSGTTLIAAEQTGRKARLIELDPLYCDVTIRRWQELTGKDAIHALTGKTFNEAMTLQGGSGNE